MGDVNRAFCAFSSESNTGIVLHCQGHAIEPEVKEFSILVEDLPFGGRDAPDYGLWVWEGRLIWVGDMYEGETVAREGCWRKPTEQEWARVQRGESPWEYVSEYNQGNQLNED